MIREKKKNTFFFFFQHLAANVRKSLKKITKSYVVDYPLSALELFLAHAHSKIIHVNCSALESNLPAEVTKIEGLIVQTFVQVISNDFFPTSTNSKLGCSADFRTEQPLNKNSVFCVFHIVLMYLSN